MDDPAFIDAGLFEAYQRELEAVESFRERYRHLYPFAGLEREDPDVQRLVEALAFFTARTRRVAERALAGWERRALEEVFPHLCAPLPSMALLTVDGTERLVEARKLPACSEVIVHPERGDLDEPAPEVLYRTTRDLTVRPYDLDRARVALSRLGEDGWELVVPIRSAAPRVEPVGELALHLHPHGDLLSALRLHHALAHHVEEVRYLFPGTRQPERRARAVSFVPAASAEDRFANPLERFRWLAHFPLGALVVRVDIDETPPEWHRLELRLRLGPGWPRELSVPPGVLLLNAVPVVNLHRALADPIPLDGTRARLLVAHPEPRLGLRVRELVGVYRSTPGGLAPVLPQSLAAPDADWYTVETEGRLATRETWVDVHAPDAFDAHGAVVVEAEWYQPGAGRRLHGPVKVRLAGRHLDVAHVGLVTPVRDAAESPVAGRRDALSRLLALTGQAALDAPGLTSLLELLGAADDPLLARVARAIVAVETTRQADARSPSGVRTALALLLRGLPRAVVPAAELLLSRLPGLLAAWTGDEPPIVTVTRDGEDAEPPITYRDGGADHG